MTKITEFTPANLKTLRAELDTALAALNATLGQKYGVSFNVGKASYMPNFTTFKLDCSLLTDSGEAVSKYRADFMQDINRRYYGLEEGDISVTIMHLGEAYRLEGVATTRTKNPIVLNRVRDDKIFLFPRAIVNQIAAARA